MELTLANFVLYVLLGAFIAVPIFTIISRSLHAMTESRALAQRTICRLCLHAFEDHSHAKILNCPVCGTANEKGRGSTLL